MEPSVSCQNPGAPVKEGKKRLEKNEPLPREDCFQKGGGVQEARASGPDNQMTTEKGVGGLGGKEGCMWGELSYSVSGRMNGIHRKQIPPHSKVLLGQEHFCAILLKALEFNLS